MKTDVVTSKKQTSASLQDWSGWIEKALKVDLKQRLQQERQLTAETEAKVDAVRVEMLREKLEPYGMRTVIKLFMPEDEGVFCDVLNQVTQARCRSLLCGSRGPCYGETMAVFNVHTQEDAVTVFNQVFKKPLNKGQLGLG